MSEYLGAVRWTGLPALEAGRMQYYHLWQYFHPAPTGMDQRLARIRGYYNDRKYWKRVTAPWLQNVLDYWRLKLEYDRPEEPKRWTGIWSAMFDVGQYGSTYETRDLVARIRFEDGVGNAHFYYETMDFYDDFMVFRKPWKVQTRAHVECVVASFGGNVVG